MGKRETVFDFLGSVFFTIWYNSGYVNRNQFDSRRRC